MASKKADEVVEPAQNAVVEGADAAPAEKSEVAAAEAPKSESLAAAFPTGESLAREILVMGDRYGDPGTFTVRVMRLCREIATGSPI